MFNELLVENGLSVGVFGRIIHHNAPCSLTTAAAMTLNANAGT
jgi:hypothetical protein